MFHRASFSATKQAVCVLLLIAGVTILVGCQSSIFQSPLESPLPLPPTLTEAALRQTLVAKVTVVIGENLTGIAPRLTPYPLLPKATKPIPGNAGTEVLAPTALAPMPGTLAGVGKIIPPMVGSFSPINYHIESTWYEDANGGRTRVFVHSGAISNPGGGSSQQGVVIIQVFQISPTNSYKTLDLVYSNSYPTQSQSGSVHITGAVLERLILESTGGTTFYFDVPLRQYVPSLAWTPTPGPVSPIATPTLAP